MVVVLQPIYILLSSDEPAAIRGRTSHEDWRSRGESSVVETLQSKDFSSIISIPVYLTQSVLHRCSLDASLLALTALFSLQEFKYGNGAGTVIPPQRRLFQLCGRNRFRTVSLLLLFNWPELETRGQI